MIRGELTNLRAVERADGGILYRWFNDPEVMRGWGVPDATVSLGEVQRRIEDWLDEERRYDRPACLVIETLAGDAVGLIVLSAYQPVHASIEISLMIGERERWGEGLATDALRAIVAVCFDGWNLHRLSLRSEAFNERAHRLYERCGFRREGTLREATFLDGGYVDVYLYALLATDREETIDAMSDPLAAQDPGELFDVVTADGQPTGRVKTRAEVHRDGDWHRAVHVWVTGIDEHGPFLLFQRRSLLKDTQPGKLDATVGGHYRAGETLAETLREVEEEIGIAPVPG